MTDNAMFTSWLSDFEAALIECGMPAAKAVKYRDEYCGYAFDSYCAGRSPDEAAGHELMRVM